MPQHLFIPGLLAATLSTPAFASTYYVATDGSDTAGDGSTGAPYATLGHALSSLPAAGGDTVVVRDGTYQGTTTVSNGFTSPVLVQAEHAYAAVLTNAAGGAEALRVWLVGSANLTVEGFVFTNADPSYTCPNGRETYYLIHLQDASDVTLRNNIVFGNNAPGTCNELLKINRSLDTAYPNNISVVGNVFYDKANAGGADLIDSVRPGEIDIIENIFFDEPMHDQSQSFITLKRQAPAASARSPRFNIRRNVFLHWGGKNDQAFVQLGEDGVAEIEISDALIENNVMVGDSPATMSGPIQLKGAANVRVRANTIVGDLPSGAFGLRIGTEGSNPAVSGFDIRNNIFSDPTGTMGSRLINSYGLVDTASITLATNLYFNAGAALPSTGSVLPTADATRVVADPGLTWNVSGLVLPRWNTATKTFPSGSKTIADEHRRLVLAFAALPASSPAVGAADPNDMPVDDVLGFARDAKPDIGAYEVGASAAAPDAGSGGSSPGTGGAILGSGGSTAGSGGAAESPAPAGSDSGCGCRAAGERRSLAASFLFAALVALARRRRHRH
jgi:hypothetical protein